jgi:hypothetical protein
LLNFLFLSLPLLIYCREAILQNRLDFFFSFSIFICGCVNICTQRTKVYAGTLHRCSPPQSLSQDFFFFGDRVSLCSPGCPGTHSVDQAGLELRNPPASASQVLGLKACTTTAQQLSQDLNQSSLIWLPSLGTCSGDSCPPASVFPGWDHMLVTKLTGYFR